MNKIHCAYLILAATSEVLSLANTSHAHDNRFVHPFSITRLSTTSLERAHPGLYDELVLRFDKDQPRGYYNGERDWRGDAVVHNEFLKPGTRGTVIEDEVFLGDNWLPFLNHYWVPWRPDQRPWWGARQTVEYATTVFAEAVQHFADGEEDAAFLDFGRCIHLLQDNGSVPHIYGDSHPAILSAKNVTDGSGYEKWCANHLDVLHGSEEIVQVSSLEEAMRELGTKTFLSSRIRGSLKRDLDDPVSGDLSELFPARSSLSYVPYDVLVGRLDLWQIDGVGNNYFGAEPKWTDRQVVGLIPPAQTQVLLDNYWERVPNLHGEDGEFYYLEMNQDTIVPARVWSLAEARFVENTNGYPLAQLWAGVEGYRATGDQKDELIPLVIGYTTGFMKYLWDFINPPPFLARVEIRQTSAGDEAAPFGESQIVYRKGWREKYRDQTMKSTRRELYGLARPLTHLPASITLLFSEPVSDVDVSMVTLTSEYEVAHGLVSERGPPTTTYPDGENIVVLDNIDLSTLPSGPIRLSVRANDLSNHIGEDCSHLDGDPSSRAARKPDGSWDRYREDGRVDSWHQFGVTSFNVRVTPQGKGIVAGESISHEIQLLNLDLPRGSSALLNVQAFAPFLSVNVPAESEIPFEMPAPGSGWVTIGPTITVANTLSNTVAARAFLDVKVTSGGEKQLAKLQDWAIVTPLNDHPDDTESVANARYPTPWLLDPDAPIGILANGWGEGLGHLLGRYGISTVLVDQRLTLLNNPGRDLRDLKVLLVGSGGFSGLDAVASFREKIADFVAGGGVLIAFTPKLGKELATLPGGSVAGYGWTEDQACFGAAVTIAERHVALSGQESIHLDVGADGYLTRWPEDATVLLRRTSNEQPAMIRYPYGRGEVFVLTLYPDWSYGGAQSSIAERNLVRDLVAYAVAAPADIPEYLAGDTVSLEPALVNFTRTGTDRVHIEAREPDRGVVKADDQELALAPYERKTASMEVTAPLAPGIYSVTYALEKATGEVVQAARPVAYFAVRRPLEIPSGLESGLRIWVTVPSDVVPRNGSIASTVHVRNETAQEFQGFIVASWIHYGEGPVVTVPGVVVPPYGEESVTVDYPAPNSSSATLIYFISPGEPPQFGTLFAPRLASAYKGFHLFIPTLSLEIDPERDVLVPGKSLPLTVGITNPHRVEAVVDLTLSLKDPGNREVWSELRRVDLDGEELQREWFSCTAAATDSGAYQLQVEARFGGVLVGQRAITIPRAAPRLSISPSWPSSWVAGGDNSTAFLLTNAGTLGMEAGSLAMALAAADGTALWSTMVPLPALDVASSVEVRVPAVLPLLPFGEMVLTVEAAYPSGRKVLTHPLRNGVELEIDVARGGARAGEMVMGRVLLRNVGEVVGPAGFEIAIPGFGIMEQGQLGATTTQVISFPVLVPSEAVPGAKEIIVSIHMVNSETQRATVTIPPARLEVVNAGTVAFAGGDFELTTVNAGGAAGVFDWSIRLLTSSADPEDSSILSLAEAVGVARLAPGEASTLHLQVPPDLPSDLYTLVLTTVNQRSGLRVVEPLFVFVEGVEITLASATDRPQHFPGEEVTANTRVDNENVRLVGGTLYLEVSGSGGIDPVYAEGTLYVSPVGDDLMGDGSRDHPFGSVQKGIDAAPFGARVLLLAGEYRPVELRLRDGTILQGEVAGGEPVSIIAGAAVIGASGVVIDHLLLDGSQVSFPLPVSGVRITDCVFREVSWTRSFGQGIVFDEAAVNVLIARNRFSRLLLEGAGVQFLGAVEDIAVISNRFEDFPSGSYGGIQFWGGIQRCIVQGNTIQRIRGSNAGIVLWGPGGAAIRDCKIVNNRLVDLVGDENGIQVWDAAERLEILGNEFTDSSGSTNGVCAWDTLRDAVIADNTFRRLRGGNTGICLWGHVSKAMMDITVRNNFLEEIGPLDGRGAANGIQVWESSQHLVITGNQLQSVTGGDIAGSPSGIGVWDGGDRVEVSRNIVRGSPAGILLRPWTGGGGLDFRLEATIANNLLLDNVVGLVEVGTAAAGPLWVRDNMIIGASRAGVLHGPGGTDPAKVVFQHNDLFGNLVEFEGLPKPLPIDGNISTDPLFADGAAGDFHVLPGSPCLDAGTEAPGDIGPYEDSEEIRLGPRPVADELLRVVHWQTAVALDLDPGRVAEFATPVSPLAASGRMVLLARVENAAGMTLAEQVSSFSVQAEEVSLSIVASRGTYRPGEVMIINGEVGNRSAAALPSLLVRVSGARGTIYEQLVSLGPGETVSFTFQEPAVRSQVLHAVAGLAAFDLPIEVAEPEVECQVRAPDLVGDEAFTLGVLLANRGRIPVDLMVDIAGEAHSLRLAPGEERSFVRECRISTDTTFVVVLDGGVKDRVTKTVAYGLRPTIAIQAQGRYAAGFVSVDVITGNDGALGAAFTANLSLLGPGESPAGSWTIPVWLGPGDKGTHRVALGELGEGTYRLAAELGGKDVECAFTVLGATEVGIDRVTIGEVPDGEGKLPVLVRMHHAGADVWSGTLTLESFAGTVVRAITMGAVGEREETFNIGVAGLAPGSYPLVATLQRGGEVVHSLSVTAALFPQLAIASVPSEFAMVAGADATMRIGVANSGAVRGLFSLRLLCGDLVDETQVALIDAGAETSISFSFPVPEDLPALVYLASIRLVALETGATVLRDLTIRMESPLEVTTRAVFDRDSYREGDPVHMTLSVVNTSAATAELRAVVSEGVYREWRDIVVTPRPETTLDADATPGALQLPPGAGDGSFTSSVLDAGNASGAVLSWNLLAPDECTAAISARFGDQPIPGETWSTWVPARSGEPVAEAAGRFLQYRAQFSCSRTGITPVLADVSIECPASGCAFTHTTREDFVDMPLRLEYDFMADYTVGDRVFTGIYTLSGRSLRLDAITLRRSSDGITYWTDQARYSPGDRVTLFAEAAAAGTVEVDAFGFHGAVTLAGPGTASLNFVLPGEMVSGTYLLAVTFLGHTQSVSLEVGGVEVRIVEAILDRNSYAPGDAVKLDLQLVSVSDLEEVTIEGWVVDVTSSSSVLVSSQNLTAGTNRLPFSFPLPAGESGMAECVISITRDAGPAGVLRLAGGRVAFDVLVPNRTPVAEAGPDLAAVERAWVALDGTGCTDPDDDALEYLWAQASGPPVVLYGSDAARLLFIAPETGREGGELRFVLRVSDGRGGFAEDGVVVRVTDLNRRPIAEAGADDTRGIGQIVALDGSASYDRDGDPLSFLWEMILRPEGSAAALDAPGSLRPAFRVDRAGEYVIALAVTDGLLESEVDTVRIATVNSAPTAAAGADQTVRRGESVDLDGGLSSDPDDDPLVFHWAIVERPESSAAVLAGVDSVKCSFTLDVCGPYRITLTVDDGLFTSEADTVEIGCLNARPVADAGPDVAVRVGQRVSLDGLGSADADGDPVGYRWSFLTLPQGSHAMLDAAGSPRPAFTPDLVGIYGLTLVVDDGELQSEPDSVVVDAGTNRTSATITLQPSSLRSGTVPAALQAWIELPSGWSAREIDPALVAITAVGKRTLPHPVTRVMSKGTRVADRDRDGRPELAVSFPVSPLLRFLGPGKNTLTIKGPLLAGGEFIGTATLRLMR